ncbi:hypothetical protein BJ322DRAFT_624494 [Thelephora terrestris]|uniref:Uncharacterized protein n=1 Tax=Thelephora terrestris TaxID=56493 RepID=A0A9P6HJK1_9AGAM|nr:hypothetical protein BJ322DRAFT_624494 [Thelephora terrestris]
MTSRKFTVFIDDVSTAKPQQAPKPPSNKAPEEDAAISSLSATEKENLHPLTGGRLRSSGTAGLKRKSSVLATKLHNPPDTKLAKQAPTFAPSKKRKATSSSDREPERSHPKPRRKPTTRQRRRPELASIAEEKDERLARRLSQSDVDSRCHDLTVSPLANVSDAFTQLASSVAKSSKTKAAIKRTGSEPELRDYIRSPADAVATPTPSSPTRRSSRGTSLPPPTLSTPERKRIYASFMFSSPIRGSPERKCKRLAASTFEDLPAVY